MDVVEGVAGFGAPETLERQRHGGLRLHHPRGSPHAIELDRGIGVGFRKAVHRHDGVVTESKLQRKLLRRPVDLFVLFTHSPGSGQTTGRMWGPQPLVSRCKVLR